MENRRTLVAIALVLFLWSGYNFLFPPQKADIPPVAATEKQQVAESVVQPAEPVVQTPSLPAVTQQERRIRVKADLFDLVFTTSGARLVEAQLNRYKEFNSDNSPLVKIISADNPEFGSYGISGGEGLYIPVDLNYSVSTSSDLLEVSSSEKTDLVFQGVTSENVRITKIFTFYPDKYNFDVNVIIENTSNALKKGTLNLSLVSKWDDSNKGDQYNFVGAASFDGEDLIEDNPDKLKEESKSYSNNILWTSFTTKYFANILKPFNNSIEKVNIYFNKNNSSVVNNIISPFNNIEAGQSFSFKYSGYLGPRDYDRLTESGFSFERIIDLGFFGIIAHPLMVALKFFYGFLGNYGFAIVLLTVCIKALFWPLTQKSYSSMKNMQKLQPEMQKLRTKYAKDKQKLNQEMMALYKEHRVNPFGGCLPMVIQIPVFFALYRVLLESIELRHAPFMLWITDLSAADTLISDALGLGFALGPLPLIMGFTMFLQQKMTPTNMDPTQAKIMLFMPVFFTFIFLSFPSGLVVYWLVNNLLTIAQQYLINRKPA